MNNSGTAPTLACASARERIAASKWMQQETDAGYKSMPLFTATVAVA